MPVSPTFPGVYIEEVSSGVRPITGVSTSVAAFVDFFRRGPLDIPIQCFSFADFERQFGGLDLRSEASYGIQQFFLNGGAQAVVVRVSNTVTPAVAASALLQQGATDVLRVFAGRRWRGSSVEDPGAFGNFIRIEIDYDTALPNELIDPDGIETAAELFNLTVSEVAFRNGRVATLQTESFRNLTLRPGARNNAVEVVNEGSKLIQLDPDVNGDGVSDVPAPFPANFRPDATGTQGVAPGGPLPADGSTFQVNLFPGGGAPAIGPLLATLDYGGATVTTSADLRRFLEAALRAIDPTEPLLSGASVRLEGGAFRVLLGRTGAGFLPDAMLTFVASAVTTGIGLSGPGVTVLPQQVPLRSGDDGALPGSAELRGTQLGKTGIHALEDVDIFNLLCLPRAAALPGNDMRQVYAEAETFCLDRRAFLLVDIPENTDTLDDMQTWLADNSGLRHRNAAVYFPRVRVADALSQNRLRSIGPSGTVAGIYARTDGERGVWKAPAGTEVRLSGVQQLDYVLTDAENGILNPLGVNCFRNFPVFGSISWGARTLDGADQQASEWKYVPIRRLALFLEESLFRGTKWVVFEPNDEPLWAQIRLNIGAFMQRLFRQGAFQGRTPREAYFVKCDGETTTQADIDVGVVNILVAFAPLKPAEFVIIRIQQLAGQIPT